MTATDTNADIAAVHMMMERLGLTAGDLTGARHPARVHTFELRVFASSLRPRQMLAALAFAAASVEYTRGLTAAEIARRRGWEWAAFTAWVRTSPQYSPLLAEMEAFACAS